MTIEITVLREPPLKQVLFSRFSKLELVATPRGEVIAWENHDAQHTTIAGYYVKGLKPEYRNRALDSSQKNVDVRMEATPVPKEQQQEISELLKEYGYLGPFSFW